MDKVDIRLTRESPLSMREEFELAFTERTVKDALACAKRYGDGRTMHHLEEVLAWLRGGDHPSQGLLFRDEIDQGLEIESAR